MISCIRCGADGDVVVVHEDAEFGAACERCVEQYGRLQVEFCELVESGVTREEANVMMIERIRFLPLVLLLAALVAGCMGDDVDPLADRRWSVTAIDDGCDLDDRFEPPTVLAIETNADAAMIVLQLGAARGEAHASWDGEHLGPAPDTGAQWTILGGSVLDSSAWLRWEGPPGRCVQGLEVVEAE